MAEEKKKAKRETVKENSRFLRGTIAEELARPSYRSSGRLANIFSTTSTNNPGIDNWYFVGGVGSSWRIFLTSSGSERPSNGGRPVSKA